MRLLVLMLLSMFSLCSTAGFQGGVGSKIEIESMRFVDGYVHVRFNPALTGCSGGDHYRMHARASTETRKALVSTLLTAYTAGLTFQYVWYTNEQGSAACSSSNVLKLDQVELTYK